MLDVKVLRLAGRQRSLVTRQQLIELGCPKALIEAWLDAGLLFRVHRGVYALAGARVDFDFKVLAGVLAAGGGRGLTSDGRGTFRAAARYVRLGGGDGPGSAGAEG